MHCELWGIGHSHFARPRAIALQFAHHTSLRYFGASRGVRVRGGGAGRNERKAQRRRLHITFDYIYKYEYRRG